MTVQIVVDSRVEMPTNALKITREACLEEAKVLSYFSWFPIGTNFYHVGFISLKSHHVHIAHQKTAIISGGAKGIGRCLVRRFLERGYRVSCSTLMKRN